MSSRGRGLSCHVSRQKDNGQKVRRLTVTECERLQGLPDGYTDVSDGKPASERDRLMALGNGMAQPCADHVIQRIVDEVGGTNERSI